MSVETFTLLDLNKFIRRLDAFGDGQFKLEETPYIEENQFSWLDESFDREAETRARYRLTQTDRRKFIGEVLVEDGESQYANTPYSEVYYTAMSLRLTKPIRLKSGKLRRSKVDMLIVKPVFYTGDRFLVDRKDYVRKGECLWWVQADLSGILPTDWFVSQEVENYLSEHAKR